jgi:hypothetical protein
MSWHYIIYKLGVLEIDKSKSSWLWSGSNISKKVGFQSHLGQDKVFFFYKLDMCYFCVKYQALGEVDQGLTIPNIFYCICAIYFLNDK